MAHHQSAAARRSRIVPRFEELESRHLLSASGFQPDYFVVPAATSGFTAYTPAQIRTAYGFNSAAFGATAANGAGQTIAIVDAFNDPNIASDLHTFDQAMGIADPPSLRVVNQNGGTSLPGTDPSQGWEVETALDVEWAHAIAPGANILLVEANDNSDGNLFAAVNYARQQPGVSAVSMSWGSNDNLANQAQDQALSRQYLITPAGHAGVTFVAATGDQGLTGFPATSPNVLAVGGTDLYLNSNNTISSETAWKPQSSGGVVWSGGGGPSQEFPGRNTPDVSYNAGVSYEVYDSFGGRGWLGVGGTSAGAPQWAALVAIADQGRALAGQSSLDGASQTLAAIYQAPASDFHDITVGSTQYESAGVGYDLATGRGTPVANSLISYLANYSGTSSGGGSGSGTTQTAPPTTPGSFSGAALSTTQVQLTWTASTGATGYRVYEYVNGQAVLVGSYGAGTTSATIGNLTPGTSNWFQVQAYNSAGTATSNWILVNTLNNVLTAPQNFKITATSSSTATLSWSAASGASGYLVYEWSGSQAVLIGNVGSGTTLFNVGGLAAGSTTYFYVSAYNATSSASTTWASVTMPAAVALSAPHVTATATSTTIGTLSWTSSPGAAGYLIYYWNGAQSVLLGNFSASTTSVTVQGMSAGSTYYFYVEAYNTNSTASSSWVSLTTPVTAATSAFDFALAEYANHSSSSNGYWW